MKKETEANAPAPVSPELLERARAHDRQALTELYEATKLEIYRCIHALVRDEELTLDIQQDSYLQAFSHLDQLREPESFLPWLRQIAVNQARAQLRRRRPTLFTELREDGEPEPELPDLRPEASPELALDRKETARLVREILDGLPDGQRLILGMYYYENIPIRQIAADTGLSQGTVKAQLFKGRSRVEQEVRQLEAKGVKLYGLSPLPFLLALLKRSEPAAEAGERVLAGVLPQAAESAAVHVGRGFFQTALGRVTLGVLAAAVLGGGAAGWRWARTRFQVGDYQPPTAVESAEDLDPDSREDLQAEPVTTEPTEPVTTEPVVTETTEPVTTEPTEPKSTEPAGADPGPSEPRPTQPGPTEPAPQPTNPEPTQPANPGPAEPTPTQPLDTEPATENTEPVSEEPTYETLPTTNPYPDYLGEITLTESWDDVWTCSFATDVEMEVSQFVFSSSNISGILVSSSYSNGIQTIQVEPRSEGTCTVGIRIPGLHWYKFATIIVQKQED